MSGFIFLVFYTKVLKRFQVYVKPQRRTLQAVKSYLYLETIKINALNFPFPGNIGDVKVTLIFIVIDTLTWMVDKLLYLKS